MGGVAQSDIDRGNSRNGPVHEILVSDDRISGNFQPASHRPLKVFYLNLFTG
jgi:hypothetical protein